MVFLNNIEEVCSIEGGDGIFIGTFDLPISLKKSGRFDASEFLAALRRAKKAVQDAGKFVFIHTTTIQEAREHLKNGFNGITINQDVVMLTKAYENAVIEIRAH